MKQKSRIEILNDWAYKISRMYEAPSQNVDTFDDFINHYQNEKVILVVYSAMQEYAMQEVEFDRSR